jgi:butyrate kinase
MSSPRSILVVNPGSTSTKLAIWKGGGITDSAVIPHRPEDLRQFGSVWGQFGFRLELCEEWAATHLERCDAVVAMGGLLRPIEGGTYKVNERMQRDARANRQGEHASNLGCALADRLAGMFDCPSFVVDPVSVDEFEPLARYSGHPCIQRKSLSHALSIHAAARRAAGELKIDLKESSFVVGHLGGGISIAPVKSGRIIDVNDAASDGPFSPERTGGLPLQEFITYCYSHSIPEDEIRSFVMGNGGLVSYLGTNSVIEAEERILRGDPIAEQVLEAMAYQIAKEIGAMAAVLKGAVDGVVLAGSVAKSKMLTGWIEERVRFIAPVLIFPEEGEMSALAQAAVRVLQGIETAKEY